MADAFYESFENFYFDRKYPTSVSPECQKVTAAIIKILSAHALIWSQRYPLHSIGISQYKYMCEFKSIYVYKV